jgi:hypothetical protein
MRTILKNGVAVMAMAAVCSMSQEGVDPPATGNLGADLSQDVTEIKAGFTQLFNDVKGGNVPAVLTDLQNGVAWTVGEIEALEEDAQSFLTAAVNTVKTEASSVDDAVARVLTIINNPELQAAVSLGESAVTSLTNLSSNAIASAVGVIKATASAL